MPTVKRRSIKIIRIAILAISVALLASCYPDHPQSTFDTSGPVAKSQLTLFYWIFWAAAIVFVVVESLLIYTLIRYRRKPGDPDPPQIHGHTVLELAWTIAPAIVLAVVAVPTVFTIFDNANSPEPNAMSVDATAHQWWWEFSYPHPSNSDATVITANELHIPVNEVVNIKLHSKDVLHSFWIPKIAGKVDMVPNNLNTIWIKADEIGEYLGQCAEFCGEAHANMRFRVIAEDRSDFDSWLATQAKPAIIPADPLAVEGMSLFEGSAECWACHTISGLGKARGTKGPDLSHVASRKHIGAGLLINNKTNLRRWIEDPCGVKPGNIMCRDAKVYTDPDRELTETQISALIAYLRSVK